MRPFDPCADQAGSYRKSIGDNGGKAGNHPRQITRYSFARELHALAPSSWRAGVGLRKENCRELAISDFAKLVAALSQ
jgi:hypothetical protein